MLPIRILILGACLSVPLAIFAGAPFEQQQEKPYALIFGTVWGPDEQPVYGVTVRLRREGDKKPKWEQISDHRGEVAFRVPAGKATYYLLPELKNFKLPDGRKLQSGDPTRVEVQGDERVNTGLHLK
jgi:hypothetical protein